MRLGTLFSVILLLIAAVPVQAGSVDAEEAFEQLKGLEGTWRGPIKGEGAAETEAAAEHAGEAVHEFRVSANGTVVMETMGPGTEHEMINMYHVDGDDLVLTHYCAGGNQPKMRLDRAASSAGKLVFDFDGGTNLDPAVDPHIHDAMLVFSEDGGLDSVWNSYNEGKPFGTMTFQLTRGE